MAASGDAERIANLPPSVAQDGQRHVGHDLAGLVEVDLRDEETLALAGRDRRVPGDDLGAGLLRRDGRGHDLVTGVVRQHDDLVALSGAFVTNSICPATLFSAVGSDEVERSRVLQLRGGFLRALVRLVERQDAEELGQQHHLDVLAGRRAVPPRRKPATAATGVCARTAAPMCRCQQPGAHRAAQQSTRHRVQVHLFLLFVCEVVAGRHHRTTRITGRRARYPGAAGERVGSVIRSGGARTLGSVCRRRRSCTRPARFGTRTDRISSRPMIAGLGIAGDAGDDQAVAQVEDQEVDRSTPIIEPTPPKMLTPPSSTTVMMSSSKPSAVLARTAPRRAASSTPASAAMSPLIMKMMILVRATGTPENRATWRCCR